MTTAKPRSTTGSKLANSVRRAKATPAEETASEVKSATKPATPEVPESETITAMPSNRVWPD
ncbi:hypothetical protein QCB45_00720 [Thiomicrorhabdus sp. ZW0627]|uniref:hypothetical protein n=1 Tax=Thiomicrorhabdus sp. ZW0627 TaxID=3039774 RepID=UPI0024365D37|nr:hypothetical protein [Thiomicrorhabdus sp. ZW0627]MDG6772849.1 hypothetical protein [Thiomicrorhabdus sp. ZW0627]